MADYLTPQVIRDTPYPDLTGGLVQMPSSSNSLQSEEIYGYTPATIQDVPYSKTTYADEVASFSLDTEQRMILGSFSFGQVGAIQIGLYQAGVSGQIKISPNGIVATSMTDGLPSITIDGITGNAVFKGTVQAGSLISGNITIGGSANGSGIMLLKDGSGITICRLDNQGYGLFGSGGNSFYISNVDGGTLYGIFGYYSGGNSIQLASNNGKNLQLYGDGDTSLLAQGKVLIGTTNNDVKIAVGSPHILDVQAATAGFAGDVSILGGLAVSGFKSSVADTKDGKVLLYANESPENWFTDFCISKETIDQKFLEVTVGPYHFIKCEDGEYLVFGKRKGHDTSRFERLEDKMPHVHTMTLLTENDSEVEDHMQRMDDLQSTLPETTENINSTSIQEN